MEPNAENKFWSYWCTQVTFGVIGLKTKLYHASGFMLDNNPCRVIINATTAKRRREIWKAGRPLQQAGFQRDEMVEGNIAVQFWIM